MLKTLMLIKRAGKKKKKRKDKKKKTKKKVKAPTSDHHVGSPPATGHHVGSIDVPVSKPCKPKFTCGICKGDQLLKDFPGLSLVSEVWSKKPVSSVSNRHVDDASSTSGSFLKSRKGKVRNPCLLC